MPLLVRKLLII